MAYNGNVGSASAAHIITHALLRRAAHRRASTRFCKFAWRLRAASRLGEQQAASGRYARKAQHVNSVAQPLINAS